jgi:hypothetical protein
MVDAIEADILTKNIVKKYLPEIREDGPIDPTIG